ncbi:uncharacterized protein LOC121855515 [Homarus americanus]|uniref:uncharacterized protein LOC121855515 n=1 Tax=Homarus americanus TaxID=6706 RepID=UPI001C489363|nr:uncharacterized protein LOC121855515 [Homarus americanus]
MNIPPCKEDLHIGKEDLIPACLFTASSARSDHQPHNARLISSVPWSPRVSGVSEWVQVDLMTTQRVYYLQHQAHPGYHQAHLILLKYSGDGIVWQTGPQVELPQQADVYEYLFPKVAIGRYFRLYVRSWYRTSELPGFKFNLLGCPFNPRPMMNASQICTTPVKPPSINPDVHGRHLVVDTTNDCLYFCEDSQQMETKLCYTTRDAGVTWVALPYYISIILGFSPDSTTVYVTDLTNSTFSSSSDCGITWLPANEEELEVVKTTWTAATHIPYESLSAATHTIDRWGANSLGIFRDNIQVASWSSCCYPSLQ